MKKLKLKINNVKGYAGEIDINVNDSGVPVDRFWRRRINDAKIDNCVEVIGKPFKPKPAKPAGAQSAKKPTKESNKNSGEK